MAPRKQLTPAEKRAALAASVAKRQPKAPAPDALELEAARIGVEVRDLTDPPGGWPDATPDFADEATAALAIVEPVVTGSRYVPRRPRKRADHHEPRTDLRDCYLGEFMVRASPGVQREDNLPFARNRRATARSMKSPNQRGHPRPKD